MREAQSGPGSLRPRTALAIAVGWMVVAQLACVLGWEAGWFDRPTALVHWLLVGVMPPALALWQAERSL